MYMIHGVIYSHYFYLLVLVIGIGGLALADWRLKLVFFDNFSAAWKSVGILVGLLLVADIIGIKLTIFSTNQRFVTGLNIGNPNLPIEELFFLFLLSYVTLILYGLLNRVSWLNEIREKTK
jgi:lycopene cyclase domain-containing protein